MIVTAEQAAEDARRRAAGRARGGGGRGRRARVAVEGADADARLDAEHRLAFREGAGGSVLESIESGVLHSTSSTSTTAAPARTITGRATRSCWPASRSARSRSSRWARWACRSTCCSGRAARCARPRSCAATRPRRRHRRERGRARARGDGQLRARALALVASVERLLVPSLSGQKDDDRLGLTVLCGLVAAATSRPRWARARLGRGRPRRPRAAAHARGRPRAARGHHAPALHRCSTYRAA